MGGAFLKKVLVIGIDNYSGAPLQGCVNDSSAVAKLLKTNGGGAPNFDVSLKLNIETKAELIDFIDKLFSEDVDAAFLYFSGHGSEFGNLETPDYKGKDFEVLMSQVLGYANKSRCKNKIIILDCCYSGKFGKSSVIQSNESTLGEGVTIMTASTRDEVATEKACSQVFFYKA